MLKVQLISWNLGEKAPPLPFLSAEADLVAVHTQENSHSIAQSMCCNSKAQFTAQVAARLPDHVVMRDVSLNAMQTLLLCKRSIAPCLTVNEVEVLKMGRFGSNKGAILVDMQTASGSMLFVNVHLDSKEHRRRTAQIDRIKRLVERKYAGSRLFVFGDFNARLALPLEPIQQALEQAGLWYSAVKNLLPIQCQTGSLLPVASLYQTFAHADELAHYVCRRLGVCEQTSPTFQPTYKMNRQYQYYQLRKPAWTDRVFVSHKLEKASYWSPRVFGSDHFPVVLSGIVNFKAK